MESSSAGGFQLAVPPKHQVLGHEPDQVQKYIAPYEPRYKDCYMVQAPPQWKDFQMFYFQQDISNADLSLGESQYVHRHRTLVHCKSIMTLLYGAQVKSIGSYCSRLMDAS